MQSKVCLVTAPATSRKLASPQLLALWAASAVMLPDMARPFWTLCARAAPAPAKREPGSATRASMQAGN
jgi:hypothetical protein